MQEAVKAKAKPRVVPAAEHTVFVLKDKWDRAEAHRKFLQEHAERKQQEYEAASQRATDQAVVADDLKKAYWKARKELDKTAASCASASVGERESVNSDDGLANVGLDDEEMEQIYPECMLEHLEAPPAKRVKARSSANNSTSDKLVGETAPVPPPVTQIQNLHLCQDEQQIMRAVVLDSGSHRHCGSALHRASQSRRGTQGVSWVIFRTGTKRASLITVGPSSRKRKN